MRVWPPLALWYLLEQVLLSIYSLHLETNPQPDMHLHTQVPSNPTLCPLTRSLAMGRVRASFTALWGRGDVSGPISLAQLG